MNTQDELLSLRRRKPFSPFRVKVSDGRSFEVTDPFMYAWNEINMLIAKEPAGVVTFRQKDIVSIDVLQPTA